MSEPPETDATNRCPHCGASIASTEGKCWLCFSALGQAPTINPYAAPVDIRPKQVWGSSLLLIVTLAVACMVLILAAPGLGVFAAIIVAPAVVRTTLLLNRRVRRGQPVGWIQRIAAFVGSVAVLIALVTLTTVAALGTFCLVAIGSMSVSHMDERLALSVAALGGLAVAVSLIVLFATITVNRFRGE